MGWPMQPSIPFPRARAARLAVSVLFVANGIASASIVPRLPAIKEALSLSNGELGLALAAGPIGGLLAGGLVGLLIQRFGSGRLARLAGTASALVLVGVGLSSSWLMLVATYLVLGIFDSTMDASMNAHGIGVERQYGRSILQGFHGMWSVGVMVGAALGTVAAAAGIPVATHFGIIGILLAAAVLVSSRNLLPAAVADHVEDDGHHSESIHVRNLPRLLQILVPVAMLGIVTVVLQSAAATWSAVFLTEVEGLPEWLAGTAFVLYAFSMAVGRLTNDRWVDRFGTKLVVRAGAAIGALGVALVIGSAPLGLAPLAFVGFALVGVGSSPMFPVMAAVAGTRPGIPTGYGVSLVSWLVRIGSMVAPALVGLAADAAGLTAALTIPLLAAVVIAVVAGPLTGGRRAAPSVGAG